MGVVIADESEIGKELAKWNTPRREGGMRPDGHLKYPQMLYRAQKRENGRVVCLEPPPVPHSYTTQPEYDRALLLVEHFNRSCTRLVHDEAELAIAKGQGWCESAEAALEAYEAQETALATAAAETLYHAQRLTGRAQAELATANAATHEHVVDVPKKKPRE